MPRKYSKTFSPAELSQPQIINNLEKIRNIFACKTVSAANHQYPENIHRLFRLQNCLGHRSSIPRKYSKTFSPAELSQPQLINNMEIFNSFPQAELSAANHQQPGNSQQHFHRQKYLSLKLSTTWRYSKSFSAAEISQPQIIIIPKKFKDFFACKTVLAEDHRYPENMQAVFHLQICLGRKSSLSRKHSKIFSPAKLSQPQIIDAPEIFKHFFTCRYVLIENHQQLGKIQRLFRLQNSLRRRSSTTWKYSKTFSPADLTWPQVIDTPKKFKDIFTCRIVLAAIDQQHGNIQIFSTSRTLSRKSSTTWKQSTTFSPAEISQSQIINNMETFKVFLACRNFLAPNHHYSEKIQRFFRLQNCLSRRSSIPRKNSKTFSPAELSQPQLINNMEIFKSFPQAELLAANHQQPGNSQQHFHRQKYLSLKLSTTWRHSKFFSPAEISQPQIIIIPKKFKDFFACKTVLAADHRYPENMQTFFHLQICLNRKSSTTWKNSKTFSLAEFSQTQIINNLDIFKDFFACRFVFAAGRRYPKNIERLFHLQNCLSPK